MPFGHKTDSSLFYTRKNITRRNSMNLRHRLFVVLLASLVGLAPASQLAAVELNALTEPLPPLNYEQNGKIVGFSSELLDMLAKDCGLTLHKNILPWARAYQMAQQQKNTILYSLVRTPERESLFQWVGPISKRRIYLYKSSRRTDISLAYIEDAKRFQIGAVQESAAVKTLLKRGFQVGKELDLAIDDDKNMRKFKAGRFDLLLSLDWAAMYNAKQNNMNVDELEPAILVDDSSEYWFGISLETSPQIVAQLNGALLQAKKDGRLTALTRRYLPENKTH